MVGIYNVQRWNKNCLQILVGERQSNRLFEYIDIHGDNTKMDLGETGCQYMGWIQLA